MCTQSHSASHDKPSWKGGVSLSHVSPVTGCLIVASCALFTHDVFLHHVSPISATTVCVMDAQYQEDNLSGIMYTLNEATLPYGWDRDVEWSVTVLSITKASLARTRGKHGGGIISLKPGAIITKEKTRKQWGSEPKNGQSLLPNRNLAQKTGQRYARVYVIAPNVVFHTDPLAVPQLIPLLDSLQ